MTQQRTFPENVSPATSQRDELGKLLFTLPVSDRAAETAPEIMVLCDEAAEAILDAGYSKPRIITTVEELDALPEGAVIRDNDGDVFEAVRCTGDPESGVPDYNCWDQIAETWPLDSDKIVLPAIVLDEARP